MKNTLRSCLVGFAVLSLALLGGCNKQSSVAPKASAQKNSFKEVTSQLDAGGELYFYLSTEQLVTNLSGRIADFREFFNSLPNIKPEDQANLDKAFDIVTSLVKDSGVEDVSGFGMSAIATAPNFYHSKAFLHHYRGTGTGFLWTLFGDAPHDLTGLDLLPASTALAAFSDLHVPLLWEEIQKQAKKANDARVDQFIDQLPQSFQRATGLDWDKVLASLGGEFGLVVTLDETKMIQVPVPGEDPMQLPEPGVMIIARVKDDTVFNRISEALQQKAKDQVIVVDEPKLKMRTVPVPLPLPIQLRPTVAASEGYLLIASTDALVREALAVKSGGKPGLKSTDEFKRVSAGVPAQGNSFSFVSQRFGQAVFKLQLQAIEKNAQSGAGQSEWLHTMLQPERANFSYCVSANTPEGWLSVGNGNQHPAKLLFIPAAAGIGVLSAIAIPNFVKARQTSQRNACMNNLRLIQAAKQQWALDKRKTGSAIPTAADLTPYLATHQMPRCPGGGQYTIGTVEGQAQCSVHH